MEKRPKTVGLILSDWEKLFFYQLTLTGYTQITDISMRKRKKHRNLLVKTQILCKKETKDSTF